MRKARKARLVEDIEDAFAICREANHPLTVELKNPDPRYPQAGQFKVYPSGRLLWASDAENPFQVAE